MSEPSRGSDATFDQIAEAGASAEQIAQATAKTLALSIWKGAIKPKNLSGGLSTVNLVVEDETGKYVVRVGDDVPTSVPNATPSCKVHREMSPFDGSKSQCLRKL